MRCVGPRRNDPIEIVSGPRSDSSRTHRNLENQPREFKRTTRVFQASRADSGERTVSEFAHFGRMGLETHDRVVPVVARAAGLWWRNACQIVYTFD